MRQKLSGWLKRQIALHWENPLVERFARYGYTMLHAYENNCFDPRINGEFALLQALPQPKVIFDVGANVGEWTLAAARFQPAAHIHAFEIVPATFQALQTHTSLTPNVTINNCGLLNHQGSVEVHCYGDSALASVYEYPDRPSVTVKTQITTGDEYCQSRGISRIDMLKLDVEGAEMQVLEGFSHLLQQGQIHLIQFEYALINEIISVSLYQYYQLLEPFGFQIGKLHPNGVHFLDFETMVSGFRFGNFVAVKTDDPTWVEAIRNFLPVSG